MLKIFQPVLTAAFVRLGNWALLILLKLSFQRPLQLLMITGHKELITWEGKDGKRVRGLAMWFIGPRHGIVTKLPTVRSQIVSFVFNIFI